MISFMNGGPCPISATNLKPFTNYYSLYSILGWKTHLNLYCFTGILYQFVLVLHFSYMMFLLSKKKINIILHIFTPNSAWHIWHLSKLWALRQILNKVLWVWIMPSQVCTDWLTDWLTGRSVIRGLFLNLKTIISLIQSSYFCFLNTLCVTFCQHKAVTDHLCIWHIFIRVTSVLMCDENKHQYFDLCFTKSSYSLFSFEYTALGCYLCLFCAKVNSCHLTYLQQSFH